MEGTGHIRRGDNKGKNVIVMVWAWTEIPLRYPECIQRFFYTVWIKSVL